MTGIIGELDRIEHAGADLMDQWTVNYGWSLMTVHNATTLSFVYHVTGTRDAEPPVGEWDAWQLVVRACRDGIGWSLRSLSPAGHHPLKSQTLSGNGDALLSYHSIRDATQAWKWGTNERRASTRRRLAGLPKHGARARAIHLSS